VGQQKSPAKCRTFFYLKIFGLYFKCYNRSFGVIYQIFTNTSIKEM
jgi:hypothetical protein